MSDKTCGHCRWFDGDVTLEDDGTGRGPCNYDPPVWVGPSPASVNEGDWFEMLMGEGWSRPSVGVGEDACRHFERPFEKRWWEKGGGADDAGIRQEG